MRALWATGRPLPTVIPVTQLVCNHEQAVRCIKKQPLKNEGLELILDNDEPAEIDGIGNMFDPLLQHEGHDHRNASQHILYTDNIQPVSFNELTAPGNAKVQVSDTPDGRTYANIAGWSEMHIVDLSLIHI